MLDIPTPLERQTIVNNFAEDLSSYTIVDEATGKLESVVCCVCDGIPKTPQWASWIGIPELNDLCNRNNLHRDRLTEFYPATMLDGYKVDHPDLEPYLLSPSTRLNMVENTVLICKDCYGAMVVERDSKKRKRDIKPPKGSIANGYVIGEPPKELTELTEVELALISRVRIYCNSWIFFGGCHQQIKGWHTFFRNRNTGNVSNIENLSMSGLKGIILVVLCGPFTTEQKAMAMKRIKVRPEKVITAYEWLKANNYHYRDEVIPSEADIPIPQLIEENV